MKLHHVLVFFALLNQFIFCQEFSTTGKWCPCELPAEAGKFTYGQVHLIRGNRVFLWRTDAQGRFQPASAEALPGNFTLGPSTPKIRYEHGELHIGRNGAMGASFLMKRASEERFKPVIQAPIRFGTFELGPDSNYLLFFAEHAKTGKLAKVAKISPGDETFETIVSLEPSGSANDTIHALLHPRVTTIRVDNHILIYNTMLGTLEHFDTQTGALRTLEVPWPASKDLEAVYRKVRKDRRHAAEKIPGEFCLQFIPEDANTVRVAWHIPAHKPDPQTETLSNPPSSEANRPERRDTQTVRLGPLFSMKVDLINLSCSEAQQEEGLKLPVWVNSSGRLVPLEEALTAFDSAQSQKPQARETTAPAKNP